MRRLKIPGLTAHRGFTDEPWRIDRLELVIRIATAAIAPAQMARDWSKALINLHDRKGNLSAVWRSEADMQAFASFLRAAWNQVEEFTAINHMVLGSSHRRDRAERITLVRP